MRTRRILCTLGPASLTPAVIRSLDASGADIFRLNLSHTSLNVLEEQLDLIAASTDRPVCLDLEGAQIRTGAIAKGRTQVGGNVGTLPVPRFSDDSIDLVRTLVEAVEGQLPVDDEKDEQ